MHIVRSRPRQRDPPADVDTLFLSNAISPGSGHFLKWTLNLHFGKWCTWSCRQRECMLRLLTLTNVDIETFIIKNVCESLSHL